MILMYVVSILLVAIGIGVYIGFITIEGKDERGKTILSKAAEISFIFIFLGFVFHMLFIQFANPSVEQIRATISAWMGLVFVSLGISILVYRQKI